MVLLSYCVILEFITQQTNINIMADTEDSGVIKNFNPTGAIQRFSIHVYHGNGTVSMKTISCTQYDFLSYITIAGTHVLYICIKTTDQTLIIFFKHKLDLTNNTVYIIPSTRRGGWVYNIWCGLL